MSTIISTSIKNLMFMLILSCSTRFSSTSFTSESNSYWNWNWTLIFSCFNGKFFFDLLNPALVLPHEFGIVDAEPLPRIKRGLTLVSKILQNIANNLIFTKEFHMRCFNDYLRSTFDLATNFLLSMRQPMNFSNLFSLKKVTFF